MKNFSTFIWSSDFEDFTGEGLLGRFFVENFCKKNESVKIVSNNGEYYLNKKNFYILKKNKYKNNFFTKYFYPFYGLLLIWFYNLKGKKTFYINYLPLWNFLLFLFLPKKTILGPITGNIYQDRIVNCNTFVRKVFFPLMYVISINIIFKKYIKLIFSTNNLENVIPRKLRKFCTFNFCLSLLKKRKKKKKNIDFLFYLRKHPLKSNAFHKFLIKRLSENKFRVVVVGDKFIYSNVKNYINIPRSKMLTLLDQTSFSVAPGDNFHSLFNIDCMSCNVKLFYDKLIKPKIIYFSIDCIFPLNFNNYEEALAKIYKQALIFAKN
jgi:hypothetical protein